MIKEELKEYCNSLNLDTIGFIKCRRFDELKEFYNREDNVLIYFDNHKNNDTYSVDEHLKLISHFF